MKRYDGILVQIDIFITESRKDTEKSKNTESENLVSDEDSDDDSDENSENDSEEDSEEDSENDLGDESDGDLTEDFYKFIKTNNNSFTFEIKYDDGYIGKTTYTKTNGIIKLCSMVIHQDKLDWEKKIFIKII